MVRRPRTPLIAFISAFPAPFIHDDADTLCTEFRVERLVGHGIIHALRTAGAVIRAHVAFCWFASVYASIAILTAVIFRRRSVIVLGGGDVANDPDAHYGIWRSRWRRPLLRFALTHADVILAVDDTLRVEAMKRARYDGANIDVLPTGFDANFWKPGAPKEDLVLTVAAVRAPSRIRVKGLDTLFAAARRLPHVPFILVGLEPSLAADLHPPANLTCLGSMGRVELLRFYQRARIYCQPSRREGLSNALCEAMLCECIPVATDVGGTAGAVGDTGFVVPASDPVALADAVDAAWSSSKDGAKARERVRALFPKERRERRLKEVVRALAG